PTHTCRIKLLLDLFPNARFVHIHRNPYAVFQSTRHWLPASWPWFHLQRPNHQCLDERILQVYREMDKVHFEERHLIPEMHKFEPPIRIQDLIRCRTGLWDQFHIMPLAGWDNLPIESPYSEADLLTVLSGQKKLPFEPGTQFHYGSGDYFLLG